MVLDPVKEFKKKDQLDRKREIKNSAMEELIRSSETKVLTIEHNGMKIKIRPAFPGKIRPTALKLASKYHDFDFEALKAKKPRKQDLKVLPDLEKDEEDLIYQVLAAICMPPPHNPVEYTDAEQWRYYDSITGEARTIYNVAEAAMKEAQQAAATFRKKSSGPDAI